MRLRAILAVVGLGLVVLVVLGLFGSGDGGERERGPRDGWSSADRDGLGGWRALLRHEGVPLRIVDVDEDRVRLLPRTTYLFAEGDLTPTLARRVLRETARGARVVAVGRDAIALGDELGLLRPIDAALELGRRARREPETAAVDRVQADGARGWPAETEALSALVVADGDAAPPPMLVGERRVGDGSLVLVADRQLVENDRLADRDNAALAVGLAGRGRVVALRPRADATAAGGLSPRVGAVLGLLVLAAIAGLLARGRRLGPAVEPDDDPAPSRSAYVDALAAALARTRDRDAALRPIRERARALLRRRVGLAPDAGPDEVAAAARRAGLDEAGARALAGDGDATDPRAAGRALAALEQRTTPGGIR